MFERRRHVRRPVHLPAKIRVGRVELDAYAEDISLGGAFLNLELDEETEKVVALIELPHGKPIHVVGRVCWRKPGAGVGICFERFLQAP